MKRSVCAFFLLQALLLTTAGATAMFNVRDYGAKGDGRIKDTKALQRAIDACAAAGGGTVLFPPGIYLSGSLHLQSGVALNIGHGATVLASPDDDDFDPYEELGFENDADHETSYFHHALLWGEDVERLAVFGRGTIDGNREKRGGPKPIALKRCRHVQISDITILNAPNYAISMLGTDYVHIHGVSILNGYCDGIDPDACQHVRISDCHIETWDDAIVPKASFSLGYRRATAYLTVTNCQLATNCNAFKLGTESGGDFKYITVSNCVMFNRPGMERHPTSGISLESVDGADIDGVVISNISMINVCSPIFLRLGNRGRDMEQPVPGSLKNVIISNITASGADFTCPIAGIPGHPVENVTLSDIRLTFKGGGERDLARIEVPEHEGKYPGARMFGDLPSYGFYCRHVKELEMRNVQLACETADLRHAFFFEDVQNLHIRGCSVDGTAGAAQMLFREVGDALVSGCVPGPGVPLFLRLDGFGNKDIALLNNDFRRISKVIEIETGMAAPPVFMEGNLMP